jgi:hypothetical protein
MSFIATINLTTFNIMTISMMSLIETVFINDTEHKYSLKCNTQQNNFKKTMFSKTFF